MAAPGRKARVLSKGQREDILAAARQIRRRRKALGITQNALDRECGFAKRVTFYAESLTVDHRSLLADDARVVKIFAVLGRLERSPRTAARPFEKRNAASVLRTRSQVASGADAATLAATITECPDQGVWITQAGCEAMLGANPICRALRSGKGCRGVKHRRGLKTKEIEVEYTPPTESELEDRPKRFGAIS